MMRHGHHPKIAMHLHRMAHHEEMLHSRQHAEATDTQPQTVLHAHCTCNQLIHNTWNEVHVTIQHLPTNPVVPAPV